MRVLLVLCLLAGSALAQQQEEIQRGYKDIWEVTPEPTIDQKEEVEEMLEQPTPKPRPSKAEFKELVEERRITAKKLNEDIEKNTIAIVCSCLGSFKDGDLVEIDHLFTGGETQNVTCETICESIKKQSEKGGESKEEKKRVKRQIFGGPFGGFGAFGAFPNFGYGGFFGGLPIGYGGLGFNLMGAWRGLGGCGYGCMAMGCGAGWGGCHFGCARSWLPPPPMPIPIVPIRRAVPVPVIKPITKFRTVDVPVPKIVPVPVMKPVSVAVPRTVNVPVPRVVNVPRRVDVPVVKRVVVPVVRPVTVVRSVPKPVPVVKPVRVVIPKPVAVPVQRRLIIRRRLMYKPALARVRGVALVPVRGVGQRLGGVAGNLMNVRLAGSIGGPLGVGGGIRTIGGGIGGTLGRIGGFGVGGIRTIGSGLPGLAAPLGIAVPSPTARNTAPLLPANLPYPKAPRSKSKAKSAAKTSKTM